MNPNERMKEILLNARKAKRTVLMESEVKAILSSYGCPITREKLAVSAENAATLASEIGFPVAVKVASPEIIHKTEARCVKLNLENPKRVEDAYQEVMRMQV